MPGADASLTLAEITLGVYDPNAGDLAADDGQPPQADNNTADEVFFGPGWPDFGVPTQDQVNAAADSLDELGRSLMDESGMPANAARVMAARNNAAAVRNWYASLDQLPEEVGAQVRAGLRHPGNLSVLTSEGVPAPVRNDRVRNALQVTVSNPNSEDSDLNLDQARSFGVLLSQLGDAVQDAAPVHALEFDWRTGAFELSVGDIDAADHLLQIEIPGAVTPESLASTVLDLPALYRHVTAQVDGPAAVALRYGAISQTDAGPDVLGQFMAEHLAARQEARDGADITVVVLGDAAPVVHAAEVDGLAGVNRVLLDAGHDARRSAAVAAGQVCRHTDGCRAGYAGEPQPDYADRGGRVRS